MPRTQATMAKPHRSVRASTKGKTVAPNPRKKLTKAERKTPLGRFAAHLEGLLAERGWDSHKFSEVSGIAEPTIRKWLRGDGFPAVASLPELAEHLNTTEHPMPDYRMVLPPKL